MERSNMKTWSKPGNQEGAGLLGEGRQSSGAVAGTTEWTDYLTTVTWWEIESRMQSLEGQVKCKEK